jgi:hypothetical protein
VEGANRIRGDAMTKEERLAQISMLENQIRGFRIVVVGGNIEGGFGRLPKSDDEETRITNIEESMNRFYLDSSDFNVAGGFDSGYVLS